MFFILPPPTLVATRKHQNDQNKTKKSIFDYNKKTYKQTQTK